MLPFSLTKKQLSTANALLPMKTITTEHKNRMIFFIIYLLSTLFTQVLIMLLQGIPKLLAMPVIEGDSKANFRGRSLSSANY